MKIGCKQCVKVFFSGFSAVIILCLIFSLYSVKPIHLKNDMGNTDYVWESNGRWFSITEGISYGMMDKNGFNNLNVERFPNILVVGSSHMEGMNVLQSETLVEQLKAKFGSKKIIYNVGISGHNLAKSLQYLPCNLALFNQSLETVIVETSSTNLTDTDIENIFTKTVEYSPSYDKGIIAKLQKLPYLRVLYQQIDGGLFDLLISKNNGLEENTQSNKIEEEGDSEESYNKLCSWLSDLENEYQTEIIIFYHPTEKLQQDGTVLYPHDEKYELFENSCEKYGVDFIDMTAPFYKLYKEEHKLPHGFVTGKIGEGHLNADGHRVIADELYKVLMEKEEVEHAAN